MSNKNSSRKGTLKQLLSLMSGHAGMMAISILCAAISVVCTLAIPFLQGDAVDTIVAAGRVDFDTLYVVLKQMTAVIIISGMATFVMNRINYVVTYKLIKKLRQLAFEKMQKISFATMDKYSRGDIVSRITSDADVVGDGLLMGFNQLFTGVLTILGTIGFMIAIRWEITLIVLILTPLSFFVAKFISSSTYNLFKKQSEARGKETALVGEIIENQKLVVAYGYQDKAMSDFVTCNEELRAVGLKAIFFSSLVNPSTRFVNAIAYAAVALAGSILAIGGGMTVGGLTSFLGYASQYTKPFNEITGVITEFQNALACAQRLFDFINEKEEEPVESPVLLESVSGNVEIKNVDFSYDKNVKLIENLSLDVKPGQKIAIVGPTGSGKTTIIQLLMRFYDVDKGEISVDGHPITSVERSDLRDKYGMVLQDTWIKAGTIRENLLFARPDATEEEMVAAAKLANAHSFIKRLPDGYDTVLTSGGESISQGQRQLLCIARVMLNLPPMLILDEATSSIDTRTEQRIQAAFGTMMEGRTSFIVAHRLSTVRTADKILVIKDGNVEEIGTHEELMAQKGFYYDLHQAQYA